ncbi:hypothetical protein NKJ46_33465 [Mesorhizobium sp. M0166]|uniref:hypothetical protein n=1 Tax=Mesorhizobium sp. M0166 TaxID=2956902 RepID=UPI003337B036
MVYVGAFCYIRPQKPDLCQSSTGKRSRQKFKAASITFNNESQPHQIEQKVVDGMCERVRLLFKLKQQGARLFDRGPATVCVYQESILSKICKPSPRPKPDSAHRTPLERVSDERTSSRFAKRHRSAKCPLMKHAASNDKQDPGSTQ